MKWIRYLILPYAVAVLGVVTGPSWWVVAPCAGIAAGLMVIAFYYSGP